MIISASAGRECEWWCELPPFKGRDCCVRSGSARPFKLEEREACWLLASARAMAPILSAVLSSAALCGSKTTELERVFDRVVVGDWDALSSVQPSSCPSSSATSKWTVGCSSSEEDSRSRALPGLIRERFGGAISLLDDLSAGFEPLSRGR